MQHVLVVDPDVTTRKLLTFLFRDEGYEVTDAESAAKARELLSTIVFDLITLEALLDDIDGIELCCNIRITSMTPIIFISQRTLVKDKVAGLKAGADDYITKPFDPNEVVARIWAVIRRAQRLAGSASNIQTVDLALDPIENRVTLVRNGKTVDLTPIETRLLRYLMSNSGHALTRDAIVTKVWGYEYEASSNLLDVTMRRLRNKIEENPGEPRLLRTVRGVGYKYQPALPTAP